MLIDDLKCHHVWWDLIHGMSLWYMNCTKVLDYSLSLNVLFEHYCYVIQNVVVLFQFLYFWWYWPSIDDLECICGESEYVEWMIYLKIFPSRNLIIQVEVNYVRVFYSLHTSVKHWEKFNFNECKNNLHPQL